MFLHVLWTIFFFKFITLSKTSTKTNANFSSIQVNIWEIGYCSTQTVALKSAKKCKNSWNRFSQKKVQLDETMLHMHCLSQRLKSMFFDKISKRPAEWPCNHPKTHLKLHFFLLLAHCVTNTYSSILRLKLLGFQEKPTEKDILAWHTYKILCQISLSLPIQWAKIRKQCNFRNFFQ